MIAVRQVFLCVSLLASALAASSSTIPHHTNYFRSDQGVAHATAPLPANLDAPDALLWRVPLDGGHSSPILNDGKIFLTTWTEKARELSTVALDETRAADRPGDWGATRLHIEALLGRLSQELRVTLLLREMVGLSYAEIAEELEVPVGTVRSRLSAAREQFRRMWEESGEP